LVHFSELPQLVYGLLNLLVEVDALHDEDGRFYVAVQQALALVAYEEDGTVFEQVYREGCRLEPELEPDLDAPAVEFLAYWHPGGAFDHRTSPNGCHADCKAMLCRAGSAV
jgi:hypothetical protein